MSKGITKGGVTTRATWLDYPWIEVLAVGITLGVQVFVLGEATLAMDITVASLGFAVLLVLAAFSVVSLNRFDPMQRSGDDATFITMSILSTITGAVLIAVATFVPMLTLPSFALWAVAIFRSARVAALGHRLNNRSQREQERRQRAVSAPPLRGRRRAA